MNEEESITAKIIVFGVFRDVIGELSPYKIYKSQEHKQEVFNAIIQNLERLETRLEELEETEEKMG